MTNTLKLMDKMGLGFMLCAFFLGAGNIIFPTYSGLQSGTNVFLSALGFLLTGVGLPLIGVIAIALAGGTLAGITQYLAKGTGTAVSVILFIVIGPAFATPRTSLVTWDLAIKPLIGVLPADSEYGYQVMITSIFFVVATFFSLFRGKLIDNIGKILTPALFILLILLACGVVFFPWGALQAPVGDYQHFPLTKGFLAGYNTMDAFAALMFGGLMVDILREKGITNVKSIRYYLIIAGLIASAGLAFVYISLFWLGATAGGMQDINASGGEILAAYVQQLFGRSGLFILSAVVILACLTTAVGVLSACADYFSQLLPCLKLNYQIWVVIFSIFSAWVANVGLNTLIMASVPALYALYPIVITIVILTFLKGYMHHPKFIYRLVMLVTLIMGILSAIKQYYLLVKQESTLSLLGIDIEQWQNFISMLGHLRLYQQDMEWLLPVVLTTVVAFVIDRFILRKQNCISPIGIN